MRRVEVGFSALSDTLLSTPRLQRALLVLTALLAMESHALWASSVRVVAGGGPQFVQATSAFIPPEQVAVDEAGNLFIGSRRRIYRVDSEGQVTVVAGTGYAGNGDGLHGGMGTILDMVADAAGNIFIAEHGLWYPEYEHRRDLRQVRAGLDSRVRCCPPFERFPYLGEFLDVGLGIDSSGTGLLVADSDSRTVYDASGRILAGGGIPPTLGDGGPATGAYLNQLIDVAADPQGNIYIADAERSRIRKVDALTGVISTVAGGGAYGVLGDGGPATGAYLTHTRFALDETGDIYIAELSRHRVRKVEAATGIITTVAGSGVAGFSGDGGQAADAALHDPLDVAINAAGDLFIADYGNGRVRKVEAATGIITTVAGTSHRNPFDGSPAANVPLAYPTGVAVDPAGNLFVADRDDHRVRRVDAATGAIMTVAGDGTPGFGGDGGPAFSALLDSPFALAFDHSGYLYISDSGNNRVRRLDLDSGIITTVAGNGAASQTGDGGPATDAAVESPANLALDAAGNLYIESRCSGVYACPYRRVERATGIISTVPGILPGAKGLALDEAGNVLFAVPYYRDGNGDHIYDEGVIFRTDPATGAGIEVVGGLLNPVEIEPDGDGHLFVVTNAALLPSVPLYQTDSYVIRVEPATGNRQILAWTPGNAGSVALGGGATLFWADPMSHRVLGINLSNRPPHAAAGADVDIECTSSAGVRTILDGSGSTDPDSTPGTVDDIVGFQWFEDFGTSAEHMLAIGEKPEVGLSLGTHRITLRVTDTTGATGTDEILVRILDTVPPELRVAGSPALLWPPDHRMVPVGVTASVRDLCDPAPRAALVSVTSSEPEDAPGEGDGHTTDDIQGVTPGAGDTEILLRAERAGSGSGRLYAIDYTATDRAGNTIAGRSTVLVPRFRDGTH